MIDPDRPLHHYEEPGAYAIAVVGSLAEDAAFGAHPYYHQSDEFVHALESWGDLGLTSLENAFMYAKNLEAVPDHLPEGVTSLSAMFNGAVSFNQDLNGWDTSRVTDFSSMFCDAHSFNGSIDQWDMSSATSLEGMFSGANSVNQA